jgi:hypothetical protein
MDGNVFLSYRRADSAAMAGRLHDRLKELFPGRVFLDVESIQPGADFLAEINQSLKSCRLLIVLIGHDWLTSTGGKSRIGDRNDYVTREIETAIEKEVPLIPVLLDGARLPDDNDLPTEQLNTLLRRNVLEIRHSSFERDFLFLAEKIYSHLGVKPPTKLEELFQILASKVGYSGFRYDEKTRAWHAVLSIILGGLATAFSIFSLLGLFSIDLEMIFATACSAFPGIIGRNSSSKGKLAIIGLTLSLVSFLVQFFLFELRAIRLN